MISSINSKAIQAVVVFLLCMASYFIGMSRAEVKIVKEQVEVVKYVEKEKAKIYSKPNATRTELIKLFNNKEL